ncbi:hypothetical protein HK405_008433 [Cladochytrium tenue]|nr:hypothetical protein HK405_008433 [Cladochytrium tenue]
MVTVVSAAAGAASPKQAGLIDDSNGSGVHYLIANTSGSRVDDGAGGSSERNRCSSESSSDSTKSGDGRSARAPVLSRAWLTHHMRQERFHHVVIGLVLFHLLLVFLDLVLAVTMSCAPREISDGGEDTGNSSSSSSSGNASTFTATSTDMLPQLECNPSLRQSPALVTGAAALVWMSVALLVLFAIEIAVGVYAAGLRHLRSVVMAVDAVVVYASLVLELYFVLSGQDNNGAPGIVILLRIWKLVRVTHVVAHTVELRHRNIIKAVRTSNRTICAACLAAAARFAVGKREFLDELRAAGSELSVARRWRVTTTTTTAAAGMPAVAAVQESGPSVRAVGVSDANEMAASLRVLGGAERLVAALQVALTELEAVLVRENMRQLEVTVASNGADPDDGGSVADLDDDRSGGDDGKGAGAGDGGSRLGGRKDAATKEVAGKWAVVRETLEARQAHQYLRMRVPKAADEGLKE